MYSQGKVVLPHLQLRIEEVDLVSPLVVVVAEVEVADAAVAVVVVLEEESGAATNEAMK